MSEIDVQIPADRVPATRALLASSYWPRLAGAFLVSLLSILAVISGWLETLPKPAEVRVLVGLCFPVFAATFILYPSVLFRDRRPPLRLVMLFGFSLVILGQALALLLGFGLLLFAFGLISPE